MKYPEETAVRSVNAMFATAMMLVATVVGFIKSASAMELITQEEAKLPNGISGSRGITLGPLIILVSPPATAGMIKSPLNLKIKFESRGGVKVDEDSVVLTYQKNPPIDLTQRSRSFISIHGINIENATVPAGTHSIRVDVKDVQGRSNFLEFGFTITR
jgi:hypothetical protein